MKKESIETERFCAFCEYGVPAPDDGSGEEFVVCQKRGVVKADAICRSFKYDLLKREPKKRAELPAIEKIDIDD